MRAAENLGRFIPPQRTAPDFHSHAAGSESVVVPMRAPRDNAAYKQPRLLSHTPLDLLVWAPYPYAS